MTWSDGREDWYVNGQRHARMALQSSMRKVQVVLGISMASCTVWMGRHWSSPPGPSLGIRRDSYTVRMGLLWKVLTEPGSGTFAASVTEEQFNKTLESQPR